MQIWTSGLWDTMALCAFFGLMSEFLQHAVCSILLQGVLPNLFLHF